MPLYVVNVPDPPAGTDWSHKVPGKYLYDVTGVTASLSTSPSAPVLADSSGNGVDLPNLPVAGQDLNLMLAQPGALLGDTALRSYLVPTHGNTGWGGTMSTAPMDWSADWSVECWIKTSTSGSGVGPYVVGGPAGQTAAVAFQNTGVMRIIRDFPDQYVTAAGAGLFDGQWHHYVWSFVFAGNVGFYRDGVQIPTAFQTPVGSRSAGFITATSCSLPNIFTTELLLDELAVYPSGLTAGEVAAHYAARTSFATYSAAVLADAPAQYYHLDDTNPFGGRQVGFEITDSQTEVALIPTGFARAQTGTEFVYSWQPRLNQATQTQAGALTTVPLPRLILPAGYTLGTFTPDLNATDQWHDVTIWWDSAYQDSLSPIDQFSYPPGAHFVYQPPTAPR